MDLYCIPKSLCGLEWGCKRIPLAKAAKLVISGFQSEHGENQRGRLDLGKEGLKISAIQIIITASKSLLRDFRYFSLLEEKRHYLLLLHGAGGAHAVW